MVKLTPKNPKPEQQWDVVRQRVNHRLEKYCAAQQSQAAQRSPVEERLWQLLTEVIMSGGKRLRPYLVTLGYSAFGGKLSPGIIDIGTSWEFLHQALLIQDDIIDRDYIRHGQPNIAGRLQTYYSNATVQIEPEHYANSGALLAADLALASAYQLLLKSGFPAEQLMRATTILSDAIATVVGGELLDTEAVMHPIGVAHSLQIAELKTASYSFVGPLQTGALLAGADDASLRKLAKLGTALGIAFQLSDDILGLFGDKHHTGKSTSSDIHEGKRTVLLEHTFEKATDSNKAFIEGIVGNPNASEADIAQFRDLVVQTRTKAKVEKLIETHLQQAEKIARDLPIIDTSFMDSFALLVEKLRYRKS